MKTPRTVALDFYVLDSLMPDLVGHDRRPSAFILYLALTRLGAPSGEIAISLQSLAIATGLSKTAVQRSLAHLARRGLIAVQRGTHGAPALQGAAAVAQITRGTGAAKDEDRAFQTRSPRRIGTVDRSRGTGNFGSPSARMLP
jgi:DNA-binding transcriptional MocR family regulator